EALSASLLDAFNRAERTVADRIRHPARKEVRETVLPQIEAAYAVGDSPRYYYIEAYRSYRALGQQPDDCTAVAFGTGWFVREAGTFRSLVTLVDVLQCNRYGASYLLPLGVL